METGVERVSTSAYTRVFAEAQIGAEIKKATEKLSAEGKEVTSIQQEQPFNGAVFWTIHANISWRKVDSVTSQQPIQQISAQPQITISANASIESLIKRVYIFLEDKEWDKVSAYCSNILDQDPECSEAYLCLLMAELKISGLDELAKYYNEIKDNKNYLRAKKFASDDLKVALNDIEQKAATVPQMKVSINHSYNSADFEIEGNTLKKYKGTDSNVSIPSFITSIGKDSFTKCSSLKSIIFPNSVTNIGYGAFSYCTGLTSIIIPDSVESICEYAFMNCLKLENVDLGNGIKSIGDSAFFSCSSLTSIEIPDSVTSIGSGAFKYCRGLTSVTIPDSVTSIGYEVFSGLSYIIVSPGNTVYDSRDNCNAIIETDSNNLIIGCTNTVIPNSVVSIDYMAFAGYDELLSITIPNSVTSIGKNAFAACDGLSSITFPESIRSIADYAFLNCSNLTNITVPNTVTSIGEKAFCNCNSLTEINASEEIKKKVTKSINGEKNSGGGCYVATAVYGSYDCPEVWTLRRFRDYSLALTWYGRLFIALYYAVSPTIVKWFGHTQWFNRMWRGKLDRMVKNLQEQGFEDTPYIDRRW